MNTEYKLEIKYQDGSTRILSYSGNENITIESTSYTKEDGKIGIISYIPCHVLTKFLEMIE